MIPQPVLAALFTGPATLLAMHEEPLPRTRSARRNGPAIWAQRYELLDELATVPGVLSHGDFHLDQLSAAGADAAHLALSTLTDVQDAYRVAMPNSGGYRATLLLTGVSRLHWMAMKGVLVPERYEDFVIGHR